MTLKAPFPWFGGKSRVAHIVWQRFGDVSNYVEPFAGSLAVLLGRPTAPKVETVNDIDCFLSNFWRAVRTDPQATAQWADWPVNEADLHARYLWIVNRHEFREHMKTDPDYFDPKIAGWWVWGLSQWIGGGWCSTMEWNHFGRTKDGGTSQRRPYLSGAGQGVHRKRPHLLSDKGIHKPSESNGAIYDWFEALSARLRRVRVCCGDWKRVLGPSPTEKVGLTGIFLDPPYSAEAGRDGDLYGSNDDLSVAHDVREWAIAHGNNPNLRIALCGYEREHEMPGNWECVAWKAAGGYGGQDGENENAARERIWFSPSCLVPQPWIFGDAGGGELAAGPSSCSQGKRERNSGILDKPAEAV